MPIYASLKKSGEKVYDAVTRVPLPKGGTRQIQKRFKLKKHAQQWIDTMSVDVTEGTYRELTKATFMQFLETFWEPTYYARVKASTRLVYEAIFRKHLVPEFAAYPLTAISPAQIERFISKLLAKEIIPDNIIGLLAKVLKDAFKKQGWI